MPNSMTGFARAETKESWGSIVCELKSVNHRYLETYFRLPEQLRPFEIEFRSQIKKALSRGKLDCSIQLQITPGSESTLSVDKDKAQQVINACQDLVEDLPASSPMNPIEILTFPGVMHSTDLDADELETAAKAALGQALITLNEIRGREGGEMAAVVGKRVQAMLSQVSQLKQSYPEIKAALETRLTNRFEELKIEVDADRLEQELVVLAQKMDIDEEIDRLQTHLEEINRILQSKEPIGRRLDFLMQELNREANTVASKSQSIQSTNSSVEMKVLIEQMREQIQNIE